MICFSDAVSLRSEDTTEIIHYIDCNYVMSKTTYRLCYEGDEGDFAFENKADLHSALRKIVEYFFELDEQLSPSVEQIKMKIKKS
ncbi:MAG: hypothetical protein IKF82_06585 [Bacilli bacterium]|nr:hypothetical protein [Bacilli bacterium]